MAQHQSTQGWPGAARYDQIYARFRWDIPPTFNFGTDVVDRFAREQDGPALIWENAAGEERHYAFSDMSRLSNKFANILRAHGVRKGDRVIVMLRQSTRTDPLASPSIFRRDRRQS